VEFNVQDRDTEVVLTITAPPNADESAQWLFAQFAPVPGQQVPTTGCGCSNEGSCR